MTIKAIRKYGTYGAEKFINKLLYRERMRRWKLTGKGSSRIKK